MADDDGTRPATRREWKAYYDEQVARGAKVDRMPFLRGGSGRVKGADGRTHAKNGDGCCGCGLHRDTERGDFGNTPRVPKDWRPADGSRSGGSTKWRPAR